MTGIPISMDGFLKTSMVKLGMVDDCCTDIRYEVFFWECFGYPGASDNWSGLCFFFERLCGVNWLQLLKWAFKGGLVCERKTIQRAIAGCFGLVQVQNVCSRLRVVHRLHKNKNYRQLQRLIMFRILNMNRGTHSSIIPSCFGDHWTIWGRGIQVMRPLF